MSHGFIIVKVYGFIKVKIWYCKIAMFNLWLQWLNYSDYVGFNM